MTTNVVCCISLFFCFIVHRYSVSWFSLEKREAGKLSASSIISLLSSILEKKNSQIGSVTLRSISINTYLQPEITRMTDRCLGSLSKKAPLRGCSCPSVLCLLRRVTAGRTDGRTTDSVHDSEGFFLGPLRTLASSVKERWGCSLSVYGSGNSSKWFGRRIKRADNSFIHFFHIHPDVPNFMYPYIRYGHRHGDNWKCQVMNSDVVFFAYREREEGQNCPIS